MGRIAGICGIILICISFCHAQPGPEVGSSGIKIGVIAGTTGLAAATGISVRRGVELADTLYDTGNRIQFIFEDDAFQPKNAVSAADKLISRDKVNALITFSGSTSLAVSSIAERRGIPLIAVTALTTVSAGKQFVYTVYFSPHEIVKQFREVIRRMDHPRVALVTSSQDALLAIRDELTGTLSMAPAAPDVGLPSIVFDEEVSPGNLELHSFVSRMLRLKPDVIVNLALPPQVAMIARLVHSQGWKGQALVGPPAYNYAEIAAAGGALADAWLVGPQGAPSRAFFERYQEVYREPSVPEGMCGHDAAKLLIEAAASGNIADFLSESSHFTGAAGVYPKSVENLFQVPAELKVITRQGEIVRKDNEPKEQPD